SAWNTLLTNIGKPFLPIKRGILDSLTDTVNELNALVTGDVKGFLFGVPKTAAAAAKYADPKRTILDDIGLTDIITDTINEFKALAAGDVEGFLFGVPKTEITGDKTTDPGEPTGTSKSETNIILTGNNEFHNESLEQEVRRHTAVSYGYAR
ncbi:unnamed protein product, partial [marine sediment metagenome]